MHGKTSFRQDVTGWALELPYPHFTTMSG